MPQTANTFNSQYADWPSQAGPAAQLARLNLYLGDINNMAVHNEAGEGRRQSVDPRTLQHLMNERIRLEGEVAADGMADALFGDCAETVIFPQF